MELEGKELVKGGISIVEGAVRIRNTNGEIKNLHSNDIILEMPEAPMVEIVNHPIEVVYRPREEKEENQKYKLERKAEAKAEAQTEESESKE